MPWLTPCESSSTIRRNAPASVPAGPARAALLSDPKQVLNQLASLLEGVLDARPAGDSPEAPAGGGIALSRIANTTPRWHILTGEYPPQPGGVSDYTYHVADALARTGDQVTIWTTPAIGETPEIEGVHVERRAALWSPRGLASLARSLDAEPAPRRLLVQYTPMSWGYRGLNLAIGRWLTRRKAAGDDIWAMVHEARYVFCLRDKPTRWLIAAASALNARALLGASHRVFYTIPAWEPLLRRYDPQPDRPMTWLPVPATVLPVHDPASVADLRKQIAPAGQTVIGHFGTYGLHADMLKETLVRLLRGRTDRVGLLIGRGGRKFAAEIPELADRLVAIDGLPPEQVSLHLQACDLIIQPYIDGVSTRRTTVMAALAHGLPVVTAHGFLSEPFWSDAGAVSLASSNDPAALASAAEALLSDPPARARLAEASRAFYTSRFAVEHTVEALRSADAVESEVRP